MTDSSPYRQSLADNLVLRTAADEGDVERVAEFDGVIHGEGVASMTYNLFVHHPNTKLDDLIFVEDERSGQVVSSLCLIPWTWRYGGVDIPTGEMGIVGTLESHRRRGLVRQQVTLFKRRLRERGCLLSQIQGIPYYYRQFGYEYALPLEGGLRLELRSIPEPPDTPFTFRQATCDDIPALTRLYDEAAQDLEIHAARDEATWRYLLTHSKGTEMERDTWVIQDAQERVVGYLCTPWGHFGPEQRISEVSNVGFDAALAALNHVKKLTVERAKPGIRLDLPAGCTLMQLARSLDAYDMGTYAWQIHVPDVNALLRALTPVLERRIAESAFAGLTRDVRIGLYRETIQLCFVAGKLSQVVNLGRTDWRQEIRLPPSQFIPLVLGYRSWRELGHSYPDVRVEPKVRMLTDALFPKTASFIYTIY